MNNSEALGRKIYDSYHGEELKLGMHGYGSAFFEQAGHTGPRQVDVIAIAPDLDQFFTMMKKEHENDLPFSAATGFYSWLTQRAAGVFYTPFVPLEADGITHEVKMGVISEHDAIQDLLCWDKGNYIAGRFAKPEHTIATVGNGTCFEMARKQNYLSHLRAASLLLNRPFSERELYNTICGISYIGDKRIERGMEKPDKVLSIVAKNQEAFARIYTPYIQQSLEEGLLIASPTDNRFSVSSDPRVLNRIIHTEMPHRVSRRMPTIEENQAEIGLAMYEAIYGIVAPVASRQTLKGFLTIGKKIVPYGISKRQKQRGTESDALIDPNSKWLSLVAARAGEIAIGKELTQESSWGQIIGGIGSALIQGTQTYIENADKRESTERATLTFEQRFANFSTMIQEAA